VRRLYKLFGVKGLSVLTAGTLTVLTEVLMLCLSVPPGRGKGNILK
jgi:hypothetical protein